MAISLIWTTMKHCLSQAHQEEVREHADEAGEEAKEQNAAVEKKRQVKEECLGVEVGVEAGVEAGVVIILSQKSIRSKDWSIMNSSYRHV